MRRAIPACIVFAVVAAACGPSSHPAVAAPQATGVAPTSSAPPPELPTAFKQAIDIASAAIMAGDYAAADRQLDTATAVASAAAADNAHLRFLVAYHRATRFAAALDFERAAAALVTVLPELARHPESPDEFWATTRS
jgi:hypothetical protein